MSTPKQRTFWFKYRARLLGGYAVCLLLSWLVDAVRPARPAVDIPPSPRMGEHSLLVLIDPVQTETAREILTEVATLAEEGFGARIPALPGLNTPEITQGGFAERAAELPMLPEPEIVIANGQAGAVALHLAARYPEKVEAVILIHASGVQEFAMLGEYHLNYALYAVSDLLLGLVDHLTPHFGSWHSLRQLRAQTRLLRQSDRRTLRPLFRTLQQPTAIVDSGSNARRYSSGDEHARLLPQSIQVTLGPDDSLRPVLQSLLSDLSRGNLPERWEADPERSRQAAEPFQTRHRNRSQGVALFLLLLGIALATLVSEDLTCAVTGLMIANGNFSWLQGVTGCLSGILIGDYLLYWAGRTWGRTALTRIPLRWMIDPVKLRETEQWFSERAARAILISRCLPGTRLPAYVAAGLLGVPVRKFLLWFLLAALIWTPLFLTVAMLLAEQALNWLDRYHHLAPALLMLGATLYFLLIHILLPSLNRQGRRKLLGRWRRFRSSEYWPSGVYYIPVVIYLLFRAMRKGRRLMDFTACNPCIPGSGLVGESKSHILDQIAQWDAIAPYLHLPAHTSPATRLQQTRAWMQQKGLTLPVVVKPDAGQRGEQVTVVRQEAQLARALAHLQGDLQIQAFCPGEEFGVFYIRPVGQTTGFLYGLTRKRFPVVVGDGQHTLEDLILQDERTVCQARMFFQQHADRLFEVPATGEVVVLSDIGNHARGTRFTEGSDLITPELTAAIDRIAQSLPGFHLGRFDLFAPDTAHLQRGESLQVIELNGVTSESTNLYDPGYSWQQRLRLLLGTWRYACAIGQAHREQGTPLLRFRELLRQFDQYRKRQHRYRLADPLAISDARP